LHGVLPDGCELSYLAVRERVPTYEATPPLGLRAAVLCLLDAAAGWAWDSAPARTGPLLNRAPAVLARSHLGHLGELGAGADFPEAWPTLGVGLVAEEEARGRAEVAEVEV
jgi:hypothetical protein